MTSTVPRLPGDSTPVASVGQCLSTACRRHMFLRTGTTYPRCTPRSFSYAGELMRISAFLVRVNVYITKPDRLRTVLEVPTSYSELPGAGRGIDIRPSSPNARFKSPRRGCGVAYPACSCRNSGFCRPPGGQHDQSSILWNVVRPACLREGGSNNLKQDVVSEATR